MFNRERTRWFLKHVLPHEPALRSWLGRNGLAGLDPDDVIQEAYSILAGLESVDGIRSPRAYLFQVARSLVIKHVRRARIVPIHIVEDLDALLASDDQPSPEQYALDRDHLGKLAIAIAAMPDKTREAFVLRRVRGLSQREIAAQMGISENTVEKHISRGIRFLASWFGGGGKAGLEPSMAGELEIAPSHDVARRQWKH